MSSRMTSANWYGIADLRIRWAISTKTSRQVQRGEIWHVLSGGHAQATRLNARAYSIVGRLDGSCTLDQAWRASVAAHGDNSPSQDEVIQVLSVLIRDGLLETDQIPDSAAFEAISAMNRERDRKQSLNAWTIRLFELDPSRFLPWFAPFARLIMSPVVCALLVAALFSTLIFAESQWQTLVHDAQLLATQPLYWLIGWLIFIPVKFVHELAHALTVQRFGANVSGMGVSLLMGVPAPYVDAKAANTLSSKWQRATVSAAGIVCELMIAGLALWCWSAIAPGMLKSIALTTVITCSVSTLAFNANPLSRMDGYFILTDLLELPNLAQRSQRFWRERLQASILGSTVIDARQSLIQTPGEQLWLWLYAPMALTWRVTILIALALWITTAQLATALPVGWSAAASLGLIGFALIALLLIPFYKLCTAVRKLARAKHSERRLMKRVSFASALIMIGLLVLPWPDRSVAIGVLMPPEAAQLRVSSEGFVNEIVATPGTKVAAGAELIRLEDPLLALEYQRAEQKLIATQSALNAALTTDLVKAQNLDEERKRLSQVIEQLKQRKSKLIVSAPHAGYFELNSANDWRGRFVREGQAIGFVRPLSGTNRITVALDQNLSSRLREESSAKNLLIDLAREAITRPIEVREYSHTTVKLGQANVTHSAAKALSDLPHLALADRHGGPVHTVSKDNTLKPSAPLYSIDLSLIQIESNPEPARLVSGQRVLVLIDHGYASLAKQSLRWVSQNLTTRFAQAGA
jgi:putative peptide zinc metalloprotease protein